MVNPAPIPLNNMPIPAQGELYSDHVQKYSENEVWKMYLKEIKADDGRMTDAWKQDAKGVLVFTGLFSATVGAFIIEFYKKLDSGSDSNKANQPSASVIWVNAMWLISLVLSLTSALVATLLQQWARRYIETPNVPNEPNDRARVRMFLLLGTEKYQMPLTVEIAPILLHLSVCLFFGGLVIIFHTINTKVAIAVDVAVGIFGVPYAVITVLPCFDIRCPYRTPISFILWYPLHAFLSFVASGLHWFLEQVNGCLDSPILSRRRILHWITSLDKATQKHWEYFMGGFEEGIIQSAKHPLELGDHEIIDGDREIINGGHEIIDGDRKIITWLFSHLALYDKSKLRELAANIPRDRIRNLIPFIKSTKAVPRGAADTSPGDTRKVVLREPLLALLRSCAADARPADARPADARPADAHPADAHPADTHAADTHAAELDVRRRSLLVCLDIIHHIAKSRDIPELDFMRANFANIDLMRSLWNDSDTTIRVTSRCICALLAKQVVRLRQALGEAQIVWLQAVIGGRFDRSEFSRSGIPTRDRMILKSFVYNVLLNQDGDFPTHWQPFKETLAILLDVRTDVGFDEAGFETRLREEVDHFNDPQGDVVAVKLPSIFPFLAAAQRRPAP